MFEIEKDIPLPPWIRKSSRFPFTPMQVGDSFFIPDTDVSKSSINSMAHQAKRRLKIELTVRRSTNNGHAGYRVRRTE